MGTSIIADLILAAIPAYIASKRGRSAIGFYLLSLFLTPFISTAIVLLLKRKIPVQNAYTATYTADYTSGTIPTTGTVVEDELQTAETPQPAPQPQPVEVPQPAPAAETPVLPQPAEVPCAPEPPVSVYAAAEKPIETQTYTVQVENSDPSKDPLTLSLEVTQPDGTEAPKPELTLETE